MLTVNNNECSKGISTAFTSVVMGSLIQWKTAPRAQEATVTTLAAPGTKSKSLAVASFCKQKVQKLISGCHMTGYVHCQSGHSKYIYLKGIVYRNTGTFWESGEGVSCGKNRLQPGLGPVCPGPEVLEAGTQPSGLCITGMQTVRAH